MSFAADGEITARIETEGQGFFQSEIAADDGEEPPRLPRPVPPLASASVAFEEGSLAVPTVRQDEADWLKRGRKGLRRGLGGVGEHRFPVVHLPILLFAFGRNSCALGLFPPGAT